MKKLIMLILALVLMTGALFAKVEIDKTTGLEINRNEFEDKVIYSPKGNSTPFVQDIQIYGNNPTDPTLKNTTWVKIGLSYGGSEWIFMNKANFLVDGERKEVILSDVKREVFYDADVGETYSRLFRGEEAKEWAEFLIKIGNSKEAQMRLSGDQYYKLYTFDKKQKARFKKLGEAWLKYFATPE